MATRDVISSCSDVTTSTNLNVNAMSVGIRQSMAKKWCRDWHYSGGAVYNFYTTSLWQVMLSLSVINQARIMLENGRWTEVAKGWTQGPLMIPWSLGLTVGYIFWSVPVTYSDGLETSWRLDVLFSQHYLFHYTRSLFLRILLLYRFTVIK